MMTEASKASGASAVEGPELVAQEVERHRYCYCHGLSWKFSHHVARDQKFQYDQVDDQRGEADGEESGRLEVRRPLAGLEGPVAIPEEVVADRDDEGADRGGDVVDVEDAGKEG